MTCIISVVSEKQIGGQAVASRGLLLVQNRDTRSHKLECKVGVSSEVSLESWHMEVGAGIAPPQDLSFRFGRAGAL